MTAQPRGGASPGFRMPAEWAVHEATWLAFPHNASDWPGKLPAVRWAYGEMARWITAGERLHLIVQDARHQAEATRILKKTGIDLDQVRFFRFPTDRGWCRDMGPIFVRTKKGGLVIADFGFSGWAKYPNWRRDNRVPGRASRALEVPLLPVQEDARAVVLEGGAIDVNGEGTILTTEECLLHPEVQVRNPGFGRGDYERLFARVLGARHTIWLGNGIAGDDTHGHVDDLCRFVNATTVVLASEKDSADPNYRLLNENRERLAGAKTQDGKKLNVVPLPMPSPVIFSGQRLPASYANFYISNAAVLVPTFNDPRDREALGILSEVIPDRPVVGIHAVDLVWGLGTLHCLSQQQPTAKGAVP